MCKDYAIYFEGLVVNNSSSRTISLLHICTVSRQALTEVIQNSGIPARSLLLEHINDLASYIDSTYVPVDWEKDERMEMHKIDTLIETNYGKRDGDFTLVIVSYRLNHEQARRLVCSYETEAKVQFTLYTLPNLQSAATNSKVLSFGLTLLMSLPASPPIKSIVSPAID